MNRRSRAGIAMGVLLALALLSAGGCAGKRRTADFKRGRDHVRAGQYAEAIPPLKKFLLEQPEDTLASNAGLYLGKAYLALGEFAQARAAWRATIENYPTSLEGHKCRYKLAFLDFVQGNREEALAAFTALADNPDGPLAPEALAFSRYIEQGGQEGP